MEVHFEPDLQAKIDQLVSETGRTPDKLIADAMAGYVAELDETRELLNSRYDDLKSGKVKPIALALERPSQMIGHTARRLTVL